MTDSDDDVVVAMQTSSVSPWVGVIAGLLPFVLSYHHMRTVNGEVVEYYDYVALAGAAIALAFGALALRSALRSVEGRGRKIGLSVLALLLGCVQIVRGLGLLL